MNEGENASATFADVDLYLDGTQANRTSHRTALFAGKNGGQDWVEDDDLIEYRGVYRQYWDDISFVYGGAGVDSIFSGPSTAAFMNPTDVQIGAGVGQLRLWGEWKNSLEYRVGLRAQDIWGDEQYIEEWEDDPQFGAEPWCITF